MEINKNSGKRSGLIAVALVILLIGAAFIIGRLYTQVQYLEKGKSVVSNTAAPLLAEAVSVTPITKDDHVRGNRSSRIALIEYSDIECPFCKRFHPTAQKIVDTYKDQVMWAYRHFPLDFHVNAQKEAEATECAGELGGEEVFWKYVDTIYARTTSNGTGFALDKLVPLAKELGLPEAKFKECLDSGKYTTKINEQKESGAKAGVSGTPGNILLNTKTGKTKLIPGAVPFEQIKPVIDAMLQ